MKVELFNVTAEVEGGTTKAILTIGHKDGDTH